MSSSYSRAVSIGEVASINEEALASSTPADFEFEYISLTDVDKGSLLGCSSEVFSSAPSRARRVVQANDVLFGTVRPNLKSHLLYRAGLKNPICSTGFAVLRCKPRYVIPEFLFACVMTDSFLTEVNRMIAGSNYPAVRSEDLAEITIELPSLQDQKQIAAVLSDTDALIESLESLLVKKRDIKQAVMQQLLTGRTRLPGFEGEWVQTSFRELASLVTQTAAPDGAAETGAQVIELEHVEPMTGNLIGSSSSSETLSTKRRFEAGDVLFGKLRAYLRKFWLADRSGLCSTEFWVIRAKPGVATSGFIRALVESDHFIDAASNAYGTHMPRSDWRVVGELSVSVPPIDEQVAMATVLSDMDAEIEALEARLAKTRDIKVGMMQELLTGRTRLPVPEGSDEVSDDQSFPEATRGEAEPGDSDADSPEVEGVLA